MQRIVLVFLIPIACVVVGGAFFLFRLYHPLNVLQAPNPPAAVASGVAKDTAAPSAYTAAGVVWGTVGQWFSRNKPKPVVVLRERQKLPSDRCMTFDVIEGAVQLTDHLHRKVTIRAGETNTKYPPGFEPYLVEPVGKSAVWVPDFSRRSCSSS